MARTHPDPDVRALVRTIIAEESAPTAAKPPEPPKSSAAPSETAQLDDQRASDPSRVVYDQTAIPARKGSIRWAAHNLILHSVDYAPSEHIEVGLSSVVPVGIYGVFPRVRAMFSPAAKIHLGLIATGGVFGTYVDDGQGILVYGAGPMVTVGDERLFFNAGLLAGAATLLGGSSDDAGDTAWAMLPNLGFSWRFHRSLRANVEVIAPLGGEIDNGTIWVILYGLRLFSENIYGDVSFNIPIFENAGDILKYAPLGIPLLTIGYQWD